MAKKKKNDKPRRVVAHTPSDVYTALLGVAFAFVLVGLLYVGWRSNELFGSFMPQAAL